MAEKSKKVHHAFYNISALRWTFKLIQTVFNYKQCVLGCKKALFCHCVLPLSFKGYRNTCEIAIASYVKIIWNRNIHIITYSVFFPHSHTHALSPSLYFFLWDMKETRCENHHRKHVWRYSTKSILWGTFMINLCFHFPRKFLIMKTIKVYASQTPLFCLDTVIDLFMFQSVTLAIGDGEILMAIIGLRTLWCPYCKNINKNENISDRTDVARFLSGYITCTQYLLRSNSYRMDVSYFTPVQRHVTFQ